MFKLALNAGHYLHTPGKRCIKAFDSNETREWWLNDRIADRIEYLLSEYEGIETLRIDDTSGQTNVSLSNRTTKANNFKADFYLSIHHNAGVNGGSGGGIQAYVYPNVDSVTLSWQKELYNELISLTGLKGNRATGIPESNLHEVRETSMPAVLLELGFMDSSVDVPIILTQDYAYKCAQACVNVIVRKARLTKKVQQLYRIRKSWEDIKSQKGAYITLENAIECCQQCGNGYKVFDYTGAEVYSIPISPVKPNQEQVEDIIEPVTPDNDEQVDNIVKIIFKVIEKLFVKLVELFYTK